MPILSPPIDAVVHGEREKQQQTDAGQRYCPGHVYHKNTFSQGRFGCRGEQTRSTVSDCQITHSVKGNNFGIMICLCT